jgi:hypothetical protein
MLRRYRVERVNMNGWNPAICHCVPLPKLMVVLRKYHVRRSVILDGRSSSRQAFIQLPKMLRVYHVEIFVTNGRYAIIHNCIPLPKPVAVLRRYHVGSSSIRQAFIQLRNVLSMPRRHHVRRCAFLNM